MRFSSLLGLSTILFSLGSLAAPTPMASEQTRDISDLSTRQIPQVIIRIVRLVVKDIIPLVKDIIKYDDKMHQAESDFTKNTVKALAKEYPHHNILVYHNQASWHDLKSSHHEHFELDIGLGFTQGYEIWVFKEGKFKLAGDRGYINWATAGKSSGPDSNGVVTFHAIP